MFGQALPRMRMAVAPPSVKSDRFQTAKHRFKNLKKIGEGAFGWAYAAKLDGKPIIVKTAMGAKGLVSAREALENMAHEIRVLHRVQRFPFVPRLIEVGLDYFVQEDVGGTSMLNMLTKGGMEAREIMATAVASGVILSEFHKNGIAHNDFEARNILLTPYGVVAIDFGLAVLRDEAGDVKFREGLEHDLTAMLENAILAASARDVPDSIRIVIASVIEKFRKAILIGRYDETTAAEISKELLFVMAQLAAAAQRDKVLKREKVRVIAI